MPASARTIAIANGKGGVGKTSTTAHVGALAAEAGNKVLLVELDVQGNLGEDLGYTGADLSDDGEAMYAAVRTGKPPTPLRNVRPNLDVIPGGPSISLIPSALDAARRAGKPSTGAVARCLAPLAAEYDLVFIDTPPIDAAVQEEALIAAAYLLIPTKTDASSRKGLRDIARRFAAAREQNPSLRLLGVYLFGVTSAAIRIRAAARQTIETELGAAAPSSMPRSATSRPRRTTFGSAGSSRTNSSASPTPARSGTSGSGTARTGWRRPRRGWRPARRASPATTRRSPLRCWPPSCAPRARRR